MKLKLLFLLAFAAFATAARAQNPIPTQESALPAGKYLLITAYKNTISTRDCEVTREKEGTFIKFPPLTGHPEFVQKPVPVLIMNDRIQFSIGTGDYERQSREHVVFSNSVYMGQLSQGEVRGLVTEVQMLSEAVSLQFYLHKL